MYNIPINWMNLNLVILLTKKYFSCETMCEKKSPIKINRLTSFRKRTLITLILSLPNFIRAMILWHDQTHLMGQHYGKYLTLWWFFSEAVCLNTCIVRMRRSNFRHITNFQHFHRIITIAFVHWKWTAQTTAISLSFFLFRLINFRIQ